MTADATRRIHHVSCSLHSDDLDTEDFERAAALAHKVERLARRLGFDVMYESVDHPEEGDDV